MASTVNFRNARKFCIYSSHLTKNPQKSAALRVKKFSNPEFKIGPMTTNKTHHSLIPAFINSFNFLGWNAKAAPDHLTAHETPCYPINIHLLRVRLPWRGGYLVFLRNEFGKGKKRGAVSIDLRQQARQKRTHLGAGLFPRRAGRRKRSGRCAVPLQPLQLPRRFFLELHERNRRAPR